MSASRAALGLAAVAGLSAILVMVVGLGPTWPVVATAAVGAGVAATVARASSRVALAVVLVVGLSGLAWIELVNEVQYGTASLSGTPPLIRWCGATYKPDGMSATAPGAPGAPPYTRILRTPAGHDVYGVAPQGRQPCSAGGALFVQTGPGHYLVYGPAH